MEKRFRLLEGKIKKRRAEKRLRDYTLFLLEKGKRDQMFKIIFGKDLSLLLPFPRQ